LAKLQTKKGNDTWGGSSGQFWEVEPGEKKKKSAGQKKNGRGHGMNSDVLSILAIGRPGGKGKD